MSRPLLSIGIAFADPGPFFELALKSVFSQTFTDWELILVDDGSVDGSLEFAKSLCDPRIRLHSDGSRRGLAPRLNQIASLAQGPISIRMDADDVMHPARLQRQMEVLSSAPPNTLIGSSAYSIDEKSRVMGRRKTVLHPGKGFAARRAFIHPTVAGFTEWFRQNRYSEEAIYLRAQDAELWCRTVSHTEFRILPEPLLFYRESGPFAYRRYMGSIIGSTCLLSENFGRPLTNYGVRLAIELSKVWISSMCEVTGHTEWLVNRRYIPLQPEEQREANRILATIDAVELPIPGRITS